MHSPKLVLKAGHAVYSRIIMYCRTIVVNINKCQGNNVNYG